MAKNLNWVCGCVYVCVCIRLYVCYFKVEEDFFPINLQSYTLHIFIHPDLTGIIIQIKYWLKEMSLLILIMLRISSIENKLLEEQFCVASYI